MKYAIVGAGAMGSIIGAVLKKGGRDVVLVDPYAEHMNKIQQNGLKIRMIDKDETVILDTCVNAAEVGPADVVIILVKCFHTLKAVQGASSLFHEKTFLCSLQNGLGNEDLLASLYPRERILQGVLRMTGSLVEPGSVVANVGAGTHVFIGSVANQPAANAAAKQMVTHLQAGGLNAEFALNVAEHVWAKAVINTCVNGTCGILRINVKSLFKHPLGMTLVKEIAREVVNVATAKGICLDYDALLDDMVASVALAGDHFPSMAQDIRYKRKTEIDSLNGAIVKYGGEFGIPTPANDYVTKFIKIIEDSYQAQF